MSIQIALAVKVGKSGHPSQDAALLGKRVIRRPGRYVRQVNESRVTVAVAAGAACPIHLGARASRLALDLLAHELANRAELSERSIFAVQRAMGDRAFGTRNIGMAATLAALQIRGDTVTMVNVGDSPVYLWRNEFLRQLSVDHTVLRRMLAEGIISETDEDAVAGHFDNLDSVLYADPLAGQFEVSELKMATRPGDLWLVCSRGLRKVLPPPRMADIVRLALRDGPGVVAQRLTTDPAISRASGTDITVAALTID